MIWMCYAYGNKKSLTVYPRTLLTTRIEDIKKLIEVHNKNNIININTDKCFFYFFDAHDFQHRTINIKETDFIEKPLKIYKRVPAHSFQLPTSIYSCSLTVRFNNISLYNIRTYSVYHITMIFNRYPYIIFHVYRGLDYPLLRLEMTYREYLENIKEIVLKIPKNKKYV